MSQRAMYTEPDETSEVPEFAQVQPGDNLRTFAQRHGVDHQRIMDLNERELAETAQARGFGTHRFLRDVPDDEGGATHDSGQRVRREPDAHVFHGQVLRLRPPQDGDPDYADEDGRLAHQRPRKG